jgi:two-component system sensor histidine kinase KdpD
MAEREARPSPEALLDAAKQEGRGRLKIFLGAAPGVGKTYEMLLSAQAKRREGIDVVVGVVEAHGRRDTEALLQGLEVVPRQEVEYKGHSLTEMDLDAILKRRPQLVLVDELAHSNAPGSRHPKRYLDVEELIAAGIDVYTTLNIQHVDSLNDVVARITRIRVRETVPDSILDRADDIEVVDLAPDDLIQRLREGKVYVPQQAERAIRHYFSPGNLTALRELALRQTAQRVDDQLLSHMQAHAISGPWAAGERVLVCVSEASNTSALIRYARRIADRLHAPWTAIYVETARTQRLSDTERDRIAEYLRLAERLGAVTITIPGRKIADEVVAYAEANNITQIVIGKSNRSRWFEMVHGSVVHDLVRRTGSISVHVISAEESEPAPPRSVATRAPPRPFGVWPYPGAAAAVGLALGIGEVIGNTVGVQSISLVFLMAVLCVAIAWGLVPALFACLLSVLAYNFFFLPPLYTFTIADPENVVALFFFALVAVIVSNLTAGARRQIVSARARAKTTAELYAFSRKIAGLGTLDDLLWATAYPALLLDGGLVLGVSFGLVGQPGPTGKTERQGRQGQETQQSHSHRITLSSDRGYSVRINLRRVLCLIDGQKADIPRARQAALRAVHGLAKAARSRRVIRQSRKVLLLAFGPIRTDFSGSSGEFIGAGDILAHLSLVGGSATTTA